MTTTSELRWWWERDPLPYADGWLSPPFVFGLALGWSIAR